MATLNPLEQKARSSFIKGILIASLIGILVAALLAMRLFQMKGAEDKRIAGQKTVAVITKDIKSGELITSDMIKPLLVEKQMVPTGAVDSYSKLSSYFLKDKNGNAITKEQDQDGEYYQIAVTRDDLDGNTTDRGEFELLIDGEGNYYYNDRSGAKHAVEFGEDTLVAKIDIGANTVITPDMISEYGDVITSDVRRQEYNVIILPSDLSTGDTIDIRLRIPTGEDYVVCSKKVVTIPELGTAGSTDVMYIDVSEGEIQTISAAIVDSYQIQGSKIYATKYTDPGLQAKSEITYVPSAATITLIQTNPNIVKEAKEQLISIYNNNYANYRYGVQSALDQAETETKKSAVTAAVAKETATQQADRKAFLQQAQE